jgi:hypothetical protein
VANSAVDLAAINTAGDDDDDDDNDDVAGIISAVLTDAIPVLVTDDVLTVVPDADGDTELLLLLSQLKIVSTVAIVVGVDVTLLLLLFSSFLPLLKKDLFLFLFLYEDDFNIPRCWGDLVVIGELLLL